MRRDAWFIHTVTGLLFCGVSTAQVTVRPPAPALPSAAPTTQPGVPEDPTVGDPQATLITFPISSPPGAESHAIVVVPREYLLKPIQPAMAPATQPVQKRYPVIYLLNGYGADYRRWYVQARTVGQPLSYWADRFNVILACLDGKASSWYLNALPDLADSKAWQWEDAIIREAVPAVDKRFRTWADAGGRGVTGMSMGGHGAIYLTARHPAVFGACSSMSGLMDLRHSLNQADLARRLGPVDRNQQIWQSNSAMVQADQFIGRQVGVMIDCGIADPFIADNRLMHDHLLTIGVPHDYVERPGAHDWAYWLNAFPYHLQFLSDRLRPAGVPQTLGQFPSFRQIVVDKGMPEDAQDLDVADMNHDGKTDIVVVRPSQVVWYENPSWERRVIVDTTLTRWNVSGAAYDCDRDGLPDLALAVGWQPLNTLLDSPVWFLRNTPGRLWTGNQIAQQPTIHRVRWVDVDGDGRSELIVAPQKGIRSNPPAYADNAVRLMVYRIPPKPLTDHWVNEMINNTLHMLNDVAPAQFEATPAQAVLAASAEGVTAFGRYPTGGYRALQLCGGDQRDKVNRGSAYVAFGRLRSGRHIIATLEPLSGSEVAVYLQPDDWQQLWPRLVIDDTLSEGSAIACGDLNGDGSDEIVVSYSGPGTGGAKPTSIKAYIATDAAGGSWTAKWLDSGGMAAAGIKVADINGDGKLDVVAAGSKTRNVKIYLNEGPAKP